MDMVSAIPKDYRELSREDKSSQMKVEGKPANELRADDHSEILASPHICRPPALSRTAGTLTTSFRRSTVHYQHVLLRLLHLRQGAVRRYCRSFESESRRSQDSG